ncbi:Ser/Thr protein phosphatase 2A [Giardia muris]|uniref:Ser/Thr protein phosphatase 2A n=1 Tax=Giardia muris TaxID=5742 RepID=A0A4Z1SUE6_GIAMU|nr:Ser/Thr protein phosphatase 2A [Giardia muris]|eukprot:TNJ29522.1 Ser/Thr protein phosphatase 2A [Giardia muris]
MLNSVEALELLQVERDPVLIRYLDNLMFEFLTSPEGYGLLEYDAAFDSEKQGQSPRLPSPRLASANNSPTVRTLATDTTLSSSTINDSADGKLLALPRMKRGLYGCVLTGRLPAPIVAYQQRVLGHLTGIYSRSMKLLEQITPVATEERLQLQREYPEYFAMRSGAFDGLTDSSGKKKNDILTVGVYLCEEVFFFPALIADLLFTYISDPDYRSPTLDRLEAPKPMSTISTAALTAAFQTYCQDYLPEERFYRVFARDSVIELIPEKGFWERFGYRVRLPRRGANKGRSKGTQLPPRGTTTLEHRLQFHELSVICMAALERHPSYDFVSPHVYRRALAIIAATRFFFDADVFGRWFLSYEATYCHLGLSILRVLWELQGRESLVGERGPLGYEIFYVLYCAFIRGTGDDTEGLVQKRALLTYDGGIYSQDLVDRVFAQRGRAFYDSDPSLGLTLVDFTIFFLADRAINSYASLCYNFNLADDDDDGYISTRDIQEALERRASEWYYAAIDVCVEDVLSQLTDMVGYTTATDSPELLSLEDLLRCRMSFNLFSAMYSAHRFAYFEQRDPYVGALEGTIDKRIPKRLLHYHCELWTRYALAEYDRLASED